MPASRCSISAKKTAELGTSPMPYRREDGVASQAGGKCGVQRTAPVRWPSRLLSQAARRARSPLGQRGNHAERRLAKQQDRVQLGIEFMRRAGRSAGKRPSQPPAPRASRYACRRQGSSRPILDQLIVPPWPSPSAARRPRAARPRATTATCGGTAWNAADQQNVITQGRNARPRSGRRSGGSAPAGRCPPCPCRRRQATSRPSDHARRCARAGAPGDPEAGAIGGVAILACTLISWMPAQAPVRAAVVAQASAAVCAGAPR